MKSSMSKALLFALLAFAGTASGVHAALPAEYQWVEYIASSGTQYIDTGIRATTTTRIILDFRYNPKPTTGSYNGYTHGSSNGHFQFGANATDFYIMISKSSTWVDTGVPVDTERHVWDLSKASPKLDDTLINNTTTSAFVNNTNHGSLYLFARHTTSGPTYYCSMEVYSCRIYDGSTLVRDFVPALRVSDSVAGLYDLVNDSFYTNLGTGAFVAGSRVDSFLLVSAAPQEYGEPAPGYGLVRELAAGQAVAVSAPAVWTNAEETVAATCVGWKLYDAAGNVVSNETGNAFTYTHPDPIAYRRLEWQWGVEYKVTAAAGPGGTVSPAVQWAPEGGTATVTASPDVSNLFSKWTGDVPNEAKYNPVVTIPVPAPCEVQANFATPGGGATWHWSGAGANTLASNPTNWVEETVPTELANIVFDETGEGKNCSWDLDIPIQSWTQTNYTSAITFRMGYGPSGFYVLRILGDVTLASGTWKHIANTTTYRQYRLYASVGGDMTIGPSATIDVTGLGYSQQYKVKTGTFGKYTGCGGTYGGYGRWKSGTPYANGVDPYGSITAPEDPGSGTYSGNTDYNGGGVVRLDVAGALLLNGAIVSNGKVNTYYTGSGGSVYIRAGTISGNGSITANGRGSSTNNGNDYPIGSGGRIAIILTAQGADFSAFDPVSQCTAISYRNTESRSCDGAPGTIYAETPADTAGKGWLILKDNGTSHTSNYANANPFTPDVTIADYSRITVTNNAKIYLAAGNTLDLRATVFEAPDTSGVYLNGGTLKPATDGGIDYDVTTVVGLGGIDATSVSFRSGASLAVATVAATFDGDMSIGGGVTATVATSLTVDGDLALDGTVKRSDGPFDTNPKSLVLHVTGDMDIGESGRVDMTAKGYTKMKCPEGQTLSSKGGSSHGGRGWVGTTVGSEKGLLPYGSVTNPATAGAGGYAVAGGGIVNLVVDGALVNNGAILAETESVNYYGGAGGTVNLRAGTLTGSGRISADSAKTTSSTTYGPAGGGRVAVRLTSPGADFSSYAGEISARGARKSDSANQWVGGAGTVWTRTAAQGEEDGTLVVDNMFAGLKSWGDTTIGNALGEGTSFGDILVRRSARLNLADGATLHVSGALSNACQFVVGNGSTVDFVGTGESRVYGDFIFSNVTCSAAGKVITVDDGATIAVNGLIALTGTSANPVTMRSATAGQPWTLNLAGTASMDGAALRDCQSTSSITVMNGTDLGGNSPNIIFVNVAPGELITWTGAGGSSWSSASSWDRARTPIATDRVLIPSGPAVMPSLASPVQVAELTVQAGASLSLAGNGLTVAGDAVLAGGLVATGSETIDVGGNLSVSSGFTAAQSTIRLSAVSSATLASAGATLHALEVATSAAAFTGDLSCTSFSVGNGSSAFNLSFAQGMTLTANAFAAFGDSAVTNGVLRCATNGGTWNLTVNQADVSGVAVKGSDASRGVTIVPSDCRDDGGNVNWLFVDDRTHWDGTSWSRGEPTSAIDAVVDPGASLSVSSPLATRGFAVSSGASVRITAEFAASGSVTVENGATVTWDVPGTIGGNLVLLPGATLEHTANTSAETYKIDLSVAGSGYVAEGAKITATARGYKGVNGPGVKVIGVGASYGGRGYTHGNDGTSSPCYGSALCPTNCGSGAQYNSETARSGGGAIKVSFGGPLVLEGVIEANGSGYNYYTPSGGSVWLTAASLSGSGTISACGANGSKLYFGGGGRVAVYLTSARSADTFLGTVSIHGGKITGTGMTHGSPGTYYLQTAADADGAGVLTSYSLLANTTFQDKDNATEIAPAVLARAGETRKARVTASAYSYLYLVQDTRVGDIRLLDSTARLYLKGHTLKVNTRRHAVSPNDATQIIYDGGEIIWQTPGTVILLR
jgi:hypothetical protein